MRRRPIRRMLRIDPNPDMKKPIAIVIALAAMFTLAPKAEARGHYGPSRHYVEYHHHCNGPAWVETYFAGYDRCGRPVYRTRVIPVRRDVHRVRHCDARPVYRRPCRIERAPRPCPPRPGVSVTFSTWR